MRRADQGRGHCSPPPAAHLMRSELRTRAAAHRPEGGSIEGGKLDSSSSRPAAQLGADWCPPSTFHLSPTHLRSRPAPEGTLGQPCEGGVTPPLHSQSPVIVFRYFTGVLRAGESPASPTRESLSGRGGRNLPFHFSLVQHQLAVEGRLVWTSIAMKQKEGLRLR